MCKEWRFDAFTVEDDNTNNLEWTALATASSTGQIGTLTLKTTPLIRANQEKIRKVWEITEQVKDRDGSLICFGGRECAEDQADANWQLLLSVLA